MIQQNLNDPLRDGSLKIINESRTAQTKYKRKKNITRFQGDYGIFLMLCSEVIKKSMVRNDMKEREILISMFAYYISKYVSFSNVMYPPLISAIAHEVNFTYTTAEVRKVLKKLYEKKIVGMYGGMYISNRDTSNWVRHFAGQLIQHLHHLNQITYYDKIKERRRSSVAEGKSRIRQTHRVKIQKLLNVTKNKQYGSESEDTTA